MEQITRPIHLTSAATEAARACEPSRMMQEFLAVSRSGAGSVVGLKVFFGLLELLIISAGIYIFRERKKLFGYRKEEGDTYASANLRMVMVVLVWIHAVIITALMIFELG